MYTMDSANVPTSFWYICTAEPLLQSNRDFSSGHTKKPSSFNALNEGGASPIL